MHGESNPRSAAGDNGLPFPDVGGPAATPEASARTAWRDWLETVLALAVATAVAWAFSRLGLTEANLVMTYLLAVAFAAARCGPWPATAAAVGAVALFDVCFVVPYFSVTVHDTQYVVTFVVMLVIGLLISHLTRLARRQAERAQHTRLEVERERLRNALLSSVSHDLRTPLATIAGASSSLQSSWAALPAAARGELLETVNGEAQRLVRLVENLLRMTRLNAGAIALQREWHPVEDVVGSALHVLGPRLGERAVTTDIAELPLGHFDAVLVEQALVNLLENAIKYSGPDAPIEVRARLQGDGICLEVADGGPGLPKQAEPSLFGGPLSTDGGATGTGLGLAICRAVARAHGGHLSAANRLGGGALFSLWLPFAGQQPLLTVEDDDEGRP